MSFRGLKVSKFLNLLVDKGLKFSSPNRQGEFQIQCPFHLDSNPSCSVNELKEVYYCHGCGARGHISILINHLGGKPLGNSIKPSAPPISQPKNPLGGALRIRPKKSHQSSQKPTNQIVKQMQQQLPLQPVVREHLRNNRGISDAIIKQYRVGWDKCRDRVSIPNYDAKGGLVDVRLWLSPLGKYKDAALRNEKGKIISWNGCGGARLFPVSSLQSDRLVLCEGELDVLCTISKGISSITSTGGVRSWKNDWSSLFNGKAVLIAYDNDQPGSDGATKVQKSLTPYAKEIRIIRWPSNFPNGGDVTDYFQQYDSRAREFLKLFA